MAIAITFYMMLFFGGFGAFLGWIRYFKAAKEFKLLMVAVQQATKGKNYTEADLRLHDLRVKQSRANAEANIAKYTSELGVDPNAATSLEMEKIRLEQYNQEEPGQRKHIEDAIAGHHGHKVPSKMIIVYWGAAGAVVAFLFGCMVFG